MHEHNHTHMLTTTNHKNKYHVLRTQYSTSYKHKILTYQAIIKAIVTDGLESAQLNGARLQRPMLDHANPEHRTVERYDKKPGLFGPVSGDFLGWYNF